MVWGVGGHRAPLQRAAMARPRQTSRPCAQNERREKGSGGRRFAPVEPADDASEMGEMRPHAPAHRARRVDQPAIGGAVEHADVGKIVEREETGVVPLPRLVAPGGENARHGEPFRHVLDAVPGLIGGKLARRDAVPEGEEGGSPKLHAGTSGRSITLTPERSRMAAKPSSAASSGRRWLISLRKRPGSAARRATMRGQVASGAR